MIGRQEEVWEGHEEGEVLREGVEGGDQVV